VSTYSTDLRIQLIADGDQAGTWGQTTNTNLGTIIEQAIAGVSGGPATTGTYPAVNFPTDADITLTANNGTVDQARNAVLAVTSSVALTAQRNIIAPAGASKIYIINNQTTGLQTVQIKYPTGTGAVIGNNLTAIVYGDGSNFYLVSSGSGGSGGPIQVNEFTATQGQTVFTLSYTYPPGTNSLAVFVNGSKQIVGINFTETTSTSFTFSTGLNAGDLVEAVYSLVLNSITGTAANIAYNQGGTGAVTYNVQAKLQQTISIQDFGAVAGADNTAAIQAAINAATDGAGTRIFLCESKISTTILVNKSNIIFDSNFTSISYASNFVNGTSPSGIAGSDVMFCVLSNNVNFENISFKQGAYVPVGTPNERVIWFNPGANNGQVLNCNFYNILFLGIQGLAGTSSILISGNYFYNCQAAAVISGDTSIIENNFSENNNSIGASNSVYSINGGTGSSIVNNICRKSAGTTAAGDIIDIVAATDYSVIGNTITGLTGGNGIMVWDAGLGYSNTNGIIANNIIDGNNLTATSPWVMIACNTSSSTIIKNNILRNPSTLNGFCSGIAVQSANNVVSGNIINLGTVSVNSAIHIYESNAPLEISNNTITTATVGINFYGITNNNMIPIILNNNSYNGTMTVAYAQLSLLQNVPIWLTNENYLSSTIVTWGIPKFASFFANQYTGNFPFCLKKNSVFYANALPLSGTWYVGDTITNSTPATGQAKGYVCTVSGTYGGGSSGAGTSTSGSPTITGLSSTAAIYVGDIVTASAGFATLTGLTVISKTSTSITVNRNANATGSCTLTESSPTWVSTGNL